MKTITRVYNYLFLVVLTCGAVAKANSQTAITPNSYYVNALTDWTINTFEWSHSEAPSFIASGSDLDWDFTPLTNMTPTSLPIQEFTRINDASAICPEVGSNYNNRFVIRSLEVNEPSNYIDNIYSINSSDLVRIGRGNSPSSGGGCSEFQIPSLILPSNLSFGANFESIINPSEDLVKTSFIGFGSYTSSSINNPIQDVVLLVDSVFSNDENGDTSIYWKWFQNAEGVFIPLATLFSFNSSFGETTYYFTEHQLLSYTLNLKATEKSEDEILHFFSNEKLVITCAKERISKVELFDLNGRAIGKHSPNNERFELEAFTLPKVFMARVQTARGTDHTLKIVQM